MDNLGATNTTATDTPPDTWARVEIFGHRKHFGRITEIERFGAKMLRVDVPGEGDDFETHLYSGGAVFGVEIMTEQAARKWHEYYHPRPIKPAQLMPPSRDIFEEDEEETQACEMCGLTKPLQQMRSQEDGWVCQVCVDAAIEDTRTCEHRWPVTDEGAEDGDPSCEKCGLLKSVWYEREPQAGPVEEPPTAAPEQPIEAAPVEPAPADDDIVF